MTISSPIPAIGEFICCPWSPKRIIDIKPYTGRYKEWFDCVLVVFADTKSGKIEMSYDSTNWAYDQHEVTRWRKENEKS